MYVTSVQIILHDGNDDDDLHVLQWWLHSAVSCFMCTLPLSPLTTNVGLPSVQWGQWGNVEN